LERRSRNFLRGLVGVFAIATVISIVFLTIARNAQKTAEIEADSRATQQAIAREEAEARATQQSIAEEEARKAFARELAASSLNVIDLDPQLSALLALQAVQETYAVDGSVLQEATNALHRAVQRTANRLILSFPSSDPYLLKVMFSPDGDRLVSYSAPTAPEMPVENCCGNTYDFYGDERWKIDGQTRIWDWRSGELSLTLPGILAADNWLAEDRIPTIHDLDGNSLKFTIWNTQNGEALSTIELILKFLRSDDISLQEFILADSDIDSVNMSPDGRYLSLSVSPLNKVLHIVWDIETGQEVFRYERTGAVQTRVMSVSFLSHGDHLITGTDFGTLSTWDLMSSERITRIGYLTGLLEIMDIARHPYENSFATASTLLDRERASYDGYLIRTVTVWDSDTGQERVTLLPLTHNIWSVAFNEDGARLATGGDDGIVTIWNAITGQAILSFSISNKPVTDVVFSPNEFYLATASFDGIVNIWDIHPDFGFELYAIGQEMYAKDVDAPSITLSPDGFDLITINNSGAAQIRDAKTGEPKETLDGPIDSVEQVTYSPDGEYIGAISQDGLFKLWDALTGEEKVSISGLYGCCFVFHPLGDLVAVTATDRSVKVFHLDDLIESGSSDDAERAHFTQIVEPIRAISYDADGSVLAVLGVAGYLKNIQVNDGFGERIIIPNAFNITSQHAGSLHALAFEDGSIGLIDLDSGELLMTLPGHSAFVNVISFTEDDNLLVSASRDGTVKIWDVSSGEALQTIFVHSLGVTDIALSPDGKRLYTAAADGTVRVYLLDIEELIELAYTRLTRWFTPEECQTYLHTDTCPPPP
jgi:WD40 repeat protein